MNGLDLQDLIDNPRETLGVELKEWLDLSDPVVRADLARHICALANYGGGFIVFGFRDDLSPVQTPRDLNQYSRDTFNAIAKKYLKPQVECEVQQVVSSDPGRKHVVLWVSGIKNVPLCAKADGPQDDKGRPQGIRIGNHYLRTAGPESAPIRDPELWEIVIKRCVMNAREDLLSSIEMILRPSTEGTIPEVQEVLKDWHTRSANRFGELLVAATDLEWPAPFGRNHEQFSYIVSHDAGEKLKPTDLMNQLAIMNQEVRDLVWTGWSMFYPFMQDPVTPYLSLEEIAGKQTEVLEANLLVDHRPGIGYPDFWRFSVEGTASMVRPYTEDSPQVLNYPPPMQPATIFSPRHAIRELSELVRHARAAAARFESARSVSFRCTWRGLKNRHIHDRGEAPWNRRMCRVEERTNENTWPISALVHDWPDVVCSLLNPTLVLFDGLEISPKFVSELSKQFRFF